ncbi:MAG: DUF2339 domain-containing protein [Candidatus Sulfopaludibacter sp.]|nr:DUF2339 domain-containing protein [Candidatus Sulfopaludibacter sp.]
MDTFLLACILIVLLVRWIVLHNRFHDIEERIAELQRQIARPPAVPWAQPIVLAEPVVPPPPAPVVTPPPPRPEPVVIHTPPPRVDLPPLETTIPQPPVHTDWESTLGGNWFNKAGVVVLVCGLAWLLQFSFAHIGPAGRVAISLAVSFAMLAAGVIFEPRERYRIFARGLLGGGWAGLYTTVYAMHAVPGALVVPDPVLGAVLLIAVATGMIAHSLRYRSQTVTGLAYFIAFGTLAIAEPNTLAVVALIPLAVSLLYIVHRFAWTRTALLGVIATYSVIVLRGDHGTPLLQAQTLFAIFWLVFEAFDILHPEAWLLPLNAAGFLGLSLMKWNADAPETVWMLLGATAAAYLASAVLRWRSGKWQMAATLASGLAAAAIFQKLDRQWVAPALLVEAELVYLAGVRLRARYLRWLASGLFAVQVGRLLLVDMTVLPTHQWTSVAAVDAVVFYANYALQAADLFFGYVAAALLALVIGNEAPDRYRSLEWLALAAGSFAVGWWRKLFDLRLQGYLLFLLGLTAVTLEVESNTLSVWGALAVSYALAVCAARSGQDRFLAREHLSALHAGAVVATLAAVALLWRVVPSDYLGIAWMALALVLLELGLLRLPQDFVIHSYVAAGLGALRVWAFNLVPPGKGDALIPVAATLLAYAMAARALSVRQRKVYAAALGVGTLFLLNALSLAVPESRSVPLWAVASLALAAAGVIWNDPVMRVYGYCVAALVFLRCWGINFERHTEPVVAASVAAACFFAAQFVARRERFARLYYPLLGASLIALLLWYESSASVLTIAWGVEGVALLAAGFPLRERVLRLSGMSLLMVCVLKLFLWDMRHLVGLPRIFSLIVLGLILLGVSWIYTRFREYVERYL